MTGSGVVVVTGATGRQGRAVSQALLAAGWPVRAMTRYPRSHAAGALAAAGAQLAVADMEDPASLDRAFAGAYGVYSVPTFMTSGLDGEVRPGRNVGDAAHRAGIRHLVQASAGTGARGTGAGSALPATAPMPAAGRTHHRPSRPVTAPGSHVVGRAQTLDVSRTGARPAHAAAVHRRSAVVKESKCRDAGSDCAAVVRGETTGEVMAQAAPHTEQVHGVDVSTEVADEIQA